MILLEFHNRVLEEAVRQRLESEKREAVVVECADFDGALFKLAVDPDARNMVTVSMRWSCFHELAAAGCNNILKALYGPMLQGSAEDGYDVTLQFDLDNLPGDPSKLARKVSMLKTHAFAAPFVTVFSAVSENKNPSMITINYRPGEAVYIKPEGDRAIVVFSIAFKDENDQVIGKVFLQEFADARRKLNNTPHVSFSHRDPPMELNGLNVTGGDNQGFVSFVLFKGHIAKANRQRSVQSIQTFRNYLHYHIKCAKAYLHTRMRLRVNLLLQVLNRAKMERKVEKKTATGRTFQRR